MDDTKCKCSICKRTRWVSFAHCMLNGWPRCCNKRMQVIETTVDLETVVNQTMASFDPQIHEIVLRRR